MQQTAAKTPARPATTTVQRFPASSVPARATLAPMRSLGTGGNLSLGATNTAAEHEAERVSRQVVGSFGATMPHRVSDQSTPSVQRSALGRRGTGNVGSTITNRIRSLTSGGVSLPESIRKLLEPRFNADFRHVKIHMGAESADLNRQLQARAFTVGNHIFFGDGEYRPDELSGQRLLAHELTHVIQQGGAPQLAGVVQRMESTSVRERAEPSVQRADLLPGPLKDKLGEFAERLPGFRMLTIIMGFNPITSRAVEASAGNVLRAALELIPGGALISSALASHGIFDRAGAWLVIQLKSIAGLGVELRSTIERFVGGLGFADLLRIGEVWERAKAIFASPLTALKKFATAAAETIIALIRDAVLLPLATMARKTPAYELLSMVLERDPITKQPVARTPEALIGGFMKLIDEVEVWQNMTKANVVPRAYKWFLTALETVVATVRRIPELFVEAFRNLQAADLLTIPTAFSKIVAIFSGFVRGFVTWAGAAIWRLLEIIFDAVAPGVLAYIRQAGDALRQILKNPLPFMKHLLSAVLLGFHGFRDNIFTHLKNGLIGWLTGAIADVYLPKKLELKEIAKFVLSVLGLTWQNLRGKLVKVAGAAVVDGLERVLPLITTMATEGPAAAWEQIKEHLQSLQEQAIGAIVGLVRNAILLSALPKLLAMLIPGVGFIPMLKTIYDTCVAFVSKIKSMAMVVKSFLDSILLIASGVVKPAATRIESALAGSIPIVLALLAGLIGLGGISDKIQEALQKIRAPVDKAVDRLIQWLVEKAKKLVGAVMGRKASDNRSPAERRQAVLRAVEEANRILKDKTLNEKGVRSRLQKTEKDFKVSRIEVRESGRSRSSVDMRVLVYNSDPVEAHGRDIATSDEPEVKEPEFLDQAKLEGEVVGLHVRVRSLNYKYWQTGSKTSDQQPNLMRYLPMKGDLNAKYVRGHLLSRHLGGKAINPNLFPITGYANQQHELKVERQMKDALKGGAPDRRSAVFDYSVKVVPKPTLKLTSIVGGDRNPSRESLPKAGCYIDSTLVCKFARTDTRESPQVWEVPSVYDKSLKAQQVQEGNGTS